MYDTFSIYVHGKFVTQNNKFNQLTTKFTRDALIIISGSKEKGRDFVYFTDVKRIPNTDLATIERLWNKFSNGKFGYSVQKVSQVKCYTKKNANPNQNKKRNQDIIKS